MAILLALIPILMIFICLFVFKQTSLKASLISYAVCGGIVLLTPMFRLQIGEIVQLLGADGRYYKAIIIEITETTVTVDYNHHLAGKDLTFEIELVEIN